MRACPWFLLISIVLSAGLGRAEPRPHLLDFPFFEIPFHQKAPWPDSPGMRPSLAYSSNFYITAHSLLGGPPEEQRTLKSILAVGLFDYFSFYIPLGNSWMHEEWHRAVLSNRGIKSFNDINTFPIGRSLIAVSHVEDADLVRLKRDHPADQVRLSSAGMESQIQQNLHLEKLRFFDGLDTSDQILLWFNTLNVNSYLTTCASGQADRLTDEQNSEDGLDLSRRDFTGLDCTAWVYDLFRPDEAYTDRGTHPSGLGLDRYIRFSDLNSKEQSFLHLQAGLSFLNFIDPFLFRRDRFRGDWQGETFEWNFKVSHTLTSFGGTVDTHLFLKSRFGKYFLTWHHGLTDTRYFPGFSLHRLEMTIDPGNSLTWGGTLWAQPRQQRVEESRTEWLASAAVIWNHSLTESVSSYVGLEAKTPGWMAGQVSLDSALTATAGLKTISF